MSHYFTNENLKSNIKKVLVKVSDNTFTFNTDNGVFSKKGMDFGTRTLIEVLLKENLYGDILDVGCGYGVIGIILSSFFNNINRTGLRTDCLLFHLRDCLCHWRQAENDNSCDCFRHDVGGIISQRV